MERFNLPQDLFFNSGIIQDPVSYARETGCASWLSLTGPEFASMENGISFSHIKAAVPISANIISDPPRVLNLNLARKMIAALDKLPRPTLVTCRMGPRASAAVYLYTGLRHGAEIEEILHTAEQDGASFCQFPEYKEWVKSSLQKLNKEQEPES